MQPLRICPLLIHLFSPLINEITVASWFAPLPGVRRCGVQPLGIRPSFIEIPPAMADNRSFRTSVSIEVTTQVRSGGLKRRKKRMTRQGGLQSRQERKPLFAQGRQIAANAAKGLGSDQRAEAAGDLLLHFDHAQVALGLIVVKIDTQIFQEAEDGFLMFAQAVQQVAGRTLFDAPFRSRRGRRSWGELIGCIEHAQKGAFPIHHFQRVESTLALCSCLVRRFFHRQQQVFEVSGPGSPVLLSLKDQFTQHMHQTERMLTAIQEVGGHAVVDTDACEVGQDANAVQGLLPSAGIDLIMRQPCRTADVLPVALSRYPHARFVLMHDGGLPQSLFDLLLHVYQLVGATLDQFAHRGFTHLHPQQVREHFGRALQRQQLVLRQIDGHGPDARSILDGSRHLWRKGGHVHLLTVRTLLVFSAVFLHEQLRRGHVHHLPSQRHAGLHLAQILLTAGTDADAMLNHFIGLLTEAQGASRMPLLTAAFLRALFAHAFALASKAIGRGRQAAIMAIFGLSVLQLFDVLAQSRNLFLQLLDQQSLLLDAFIALGHLLTQVLIFCLQMPAFFFRHHASTLLALMTFGKSQPNLGSYVLRWIDANIYLYYTICGEGVPMLFP